MTTRYLAPAPDLFPSALTTALYRAWPNAASEFVASLGYVYWHTMRRAARDRQAKNLAPAQSAQLLDTLGHLLEATTVTFVTWSDADTESPAPYPLGDSQPDHAPDPIARNAVLTAMHNGLPQCGALPDGATYVAIPCYAYGTLDRADLAASKQPEWLVIAEALERNLDCTEECIPDDPAHPKEPTCPALLGVMLAHRPGGAPALSALAWQRAFFCAAYAAQCIAALAAEDRLPAVPRCPVVARPPAAPASWRSAIGAMFTRDTVADQLTRLHTAEPIVWQECLHHAYTQLGFGHPAKLHPKHLYERLSRYQNAGALLAMTEMTKTSATAMSMTALTDEWLGTLRNVMSGVTQVIPDAQTVVFAASKGDGHFTIQHTLDATLTPAQEAAFAMVALWAAMQGEATHDVATDERLLFQHLRTVAPTTAPLVAIPVYNWRATGRKEWPDLHGVFIGIRHADAQLPSAAMWCAWVLAAQYLLSPLAAAVEGKKAPYLPVDVERSVDTGCRKPFDPRSARGQFFDQFHAKGR
ncbi:MAG: hypothetical protein HY543_03305 [Deltaproteobacteria bacterium]|nr:hypothetical protein [Deltaproteobacteria bacterium]